MRTLRGPTWDLFARVHLATYGGRRCPSASWYSSKALDVLASRLGKPRKALEDEILLSDYLGSGVTIGDQKSSSRKREPVHPKRVPADLANPNWGTSTETDVEESVRERAAVQAGLRVGKVVSPPRSQRKDRRPVPARLARRANEGVLEMVDAMSSAYGSSLELGVASDGETALSESLPATEVTEAEASGAREPVRLRVLSWHRQEMCRMVCRQILGNCLQALRTLQHKHSHENPMWDFERHLAKLHVESARIVRLVDYLARLHHQVQHGPMRKKYRPGAPLDMNISRLKEVMLEERRDMSASFNAAMGRRVSEDRFIRHFLDGDISWATVTKLLRGRTSSFTQKAS